MKTIKVLSKNNCQACRMLKNFLSAEKVIFEDSNIEDNPTTIEFLHNMGIHSLPVLMIDEKVVCYGFTDRKKLQNILKEYNIL